MTPSTSLEWPQVEKTLDGIFERKFYTNHGPLVRTFETKLAESLGVKHAICMTNSSIGMMIAAKALELKGNVITPAIGGPRATQSIIWSGLNPILCDVNPDTLLIEPENIVGLLANTSAILCMPFFGTPVLSEKTVCFIRERGLKLYFDNEFVLGSVIDQKWDSDQGNLHIFSFQKTGAVDALGGACVATNDDDLAARIRNIRSSYGAGYAVEVPLTGNGRMSEAQAGIGLLCLGAQEKRRKHSLKMINCFQKNLAEIDGIEFFEGGKNVDTPYQFIFSIHANESGFTKSDLIKIFQAKKVSYDSVTFKGLHTSKLMREIHPTNSNDCLPVTDQICKTTIRLPLFPNMTLDDVEFICDTIRCASSNV